jgi:hypothetical protein
MRQMPEHRAQLGVLRNRKPHVPPFISSVSSSRYYRDSPLPFFFFIFPMARSKQERLREVGQGHAFCARRASGRSEAESLEEPPALRTITRGKMGESQPRSLVDDPLRACAEWGQADFIVTLNPKDFQQRLLSAHVIRPDERVPTTGLRRQPRRS